MLYNIGMTLINVTSRHEGSIKQKVVVEIECSLDAIPVERRAARLVKAVTNTHLWEQSEQLQYSFDGAGILVKCKRCKMLAARNIKDYNLVYAKEALTCREYMVKSVMD